MENIPIKEVKGAFELIREIEKLKVRKCKSALVSNVVNAVNNLIMVATRKSF